MSDTVFILGAGASEKAGAPLMQEFLDVAEDLWRTGTVNDKEFEAVFKGIGKLQAVHSKSRLELVNVESVFAAFEMARVLKKFPGMRDDEIDALLESLRVVIAKTIESRLEFRVIRQQANPPVPYDSFVQLLLFLEQQARPQQRVSVMTFNYDVAIDYALYFHGIPIDYSLEGKSDPESIPVLKLHGSLNWARCPVCDKVLPWRLNEFFGDHKWRDLTGEVRLVTLPIGSKIGSFRHAKDHVVDERPVIVPPTWNKTEYHSSLSQVWKRAAAELASAQNILVIGYSLPPTDPFFHHLYAIGSVGEDPLKRFWVFNPDNTGEAEQRFRRILGTGAEARFRYFPNTFEESISVIKQEFRKRA